MAESTKTRREFLQQSLLAGAGLTLSAMGMPASSYARILGANDRVNVGLVGFSDRARQALLPAFFNNNKALNFDLIAVSDIWNRRREEGKAFLEQKTGHSVQACVNNDELYKIKDLDAVFIASADFQHAYHTIEAVKNKCDVYSEKPFAETMEDARKALKAVKESGKIMQVGTQRRSGPSYHSAANFIKEGKFGPITMVEMTWNVNQPGRWRRPELVNSIRESDTDWKRFLAGRPADKWDPRKYLEYRLFWPYSSGIFGQWMTHQIDTVHWFSGLKHPRSAVANGGIYMWKDGRKNPDTLTAVFEYGPENDPTSGFQVMYSSRFHNSAGGTKEIYYSNGGTIDMSTNKISPTGGLTEKEAQEMGMHANLLPSMTLSSEGAAVTSANTGVDSLTNAHVHNWMSCVRERKQPNAPIEAAYSHSIALIMGNAAYRTGMKATFDETTQEVMVGGKVFTM
ncbi:Predicted dehydrogenase [Chitinophaga terrae (ex Kim and Jung 2007)]|uniref:Predicted dehydrogenase n=1 Tax=Chitinophaga terrae (ex Kim and Jung 2007) TaxID=408074 RepID=A0A1H3X959_9BACT|nr:Gfo/Idh/MocA family oxidoreductase [Chitinophaga terrae (ex Kim and Jung 2007)]MDQ0108940.1 putative dehydrogenase [Chitinophaga terrae (ex Kim and Jung 2007)]GEP89848.1 oxidoreductase [Chitinophaga terrae (ex Kim and Jung 2007)]SDZ95926.1 Predicted dehydrogenase [Chitinophaga terrae (ex Kim and Jung 2007)]